MSCTELSELSHICHQHWFCDIGILSPIYDFLWTNVFCEGYVITNEPPVRPLCHFTYFLTIIIWFWHFNSAAFIEKNAERVPMASFP